MSLNDDVQTSQKFDQLTIQPPLTKKISISQGQGKSPLKRGQIKITFQNVRNYIIDDPKNRQFYDVQKMQQYFRTLPYFDKICSKLDPSRQATVLEKFCKKLRFSILQKGEFLFKPNEKADNFYILLDGKVSVLIPKRDDIIEIEKQQIPFKLTKNIQNQVIQFYETSPSLRLKTFLQKNYQQTANRLSVTSLTQEEGLIQSPTSNLTPSENKNSQIQVLKVIQTFPQSTNPSPFKIKHLSEYNMNDLQVPQQNNSRTSLLQVPKSKRESMKSVQNLDLTSCIIPKIVKQQFTKEQQSIIDEQNRQFNLVVERQIFQNLLDFESYLKQSESEQYGYQYQYLFDSFVFKYTFGKLLSSGEAIGGVDILNNKSRREAVLCVQDCQFGYISKSEYIEILKETEEAKFNKKLNRLIQSLDPEIPHLRRQMGRLVSFLKRQTYKRGQIIYSQNEEVKGCYLITEGEIEIVQELLMNPPESHLEKYAYKQIQPNKQLHTIAYVSQGQYIGEEEMILGQQLRNSSAVCNSYECKIYFIEKSHFLKLISDQIDIKLAFEKSIKQRREFNSQKFNSLQKIIQSNYNDKFIQKDTTNSIKHLQKYRDDKNQFRDCFQKILHLEKESLKRKEVPKSQERIGGLSLNKFDVNDQSGMKKLKKKAVLKIKSKSQHNLKEKNQIQLNVSIKLKEHQNNTAEALTDYYIKQQNKLKCQSDKENMLQRSTSFNLNSQNEENAMRKDKKQENNQKNENEVKKQENDYNQRPKLDMLQYLLQGNKHAQCQVSNYLKKLQKKESNKEKMSKTEGSTFFQGVYQKINENFINKQKQEEQNQIFSSNIECKKTKNIHITHQDDSNSKNQLTATSTNTIKNQEKQIFCGPVSRPYTPDLGLWTNAINQQNQEINLSKTQNKFCSILNNLTQNRNHEVHLIKSHKCFQTSHISHKQLIKKNSQILTVEDYQKTSSSLKNRSNHQFQGINSGEQVIKVSGLKQNNISTSYITSNIQQNILNYQDNSNGEDQPKTNNIESYINQFEQMTSYHINQVFKPKQRPLSSRNIRSAQFRNTRNTSTDRDTNCINKTILNGQNFSQSRHDLSFESKISNNKSARIIIVNHMGQPKRYMY